MPELPEVETIVRSLRSGGMTGESIIDRQIQSVDLFNLRTLICSGDPANILSGVRILSADRRGKYIRIQTSGPWILIHLRMSGSLRCEPETAGSLLKHDRMLFHFTDGTRLVFNDIRKFGRIWITSDPEEVLAGLGIEPLSDGFTPEWLLSGLSGQRRMIKSILLDQSFIAGIGNIYADESLFEAGILPMRTGESISVDECRLLRDAIRAKLNLAIEKNGSSFDIAYQGGNFQSEFRVYQREGSPCPRCGEIIQRTVISQRGTHFCPKCQK